MGTAARSPCATGSGTQQAWLTVPSSLPNLAALVAGRQYGVLVWRQPATTAAAPTELHLPASFTPANTVVVGDLATRYGLPASGAVAAAGEVGPTTARRVVIDATGTTAGTVHYVLLVNAGDGAGVTAAALAAARTELTTWAAARFG